MNFFRKVVGGEKNKTKSPAVTNLDKGQVEKIVGNFKKLDHASFQSVYSTLGPLIEPLFKYLKNKDERVETEKVIQLADKLYGNNVEVAEALTDVFGDLLKVYTSLVAGVSHRDNWSEQDSAHLLEYFERDGPSDPRKLANWLIENPMLGSLVKYLFAPLAFETAPGLMPTLSHPSDLLGKTAIAVINAHVPMERRLNWYNLFSTKRQGSSFSQLSQKIDAQGPCLLVIKATNGTIFGGFASEGFLSGPLYRGDATTFLFTSHPKVEISHATGFSTNYAYMNYQQSQMPNGIGIGGYDNVWPLFINEEFGKGMTLGHVSSFEKICLSGEQEFKIDAVEAWRIGEKPRIELDEDLESPHAHKSVLDRDPQAKALLEMSGRKMHSEAYRDPQPMMDE